MERLPKTVTDTNPNTLALSELATMVPLKGPGGLLVRPRTAFKDTVVVMADLNPKPKVQLWKDKQNGI